MTIDELTEWLCHGERSEPSQRWRIELSPVDRARRRMSSAQAQAGALTTE